MLAACPGLLQRHAMGERTRLEVREDAVFAALAAGERAGARVLSVQPVRQSLEEYFFNEVLASGPLDQAWEAGD